MQILILFARAVIAAFAAWAVVSAAKRSPFGVWSLVGVAALVLSFLLPPPYSYLLLLFGAALAVAGAWKALTPGRDP